MTSINTNADFNSTLNQLKGVFYQLGGSSIKGGTYVNSIFGIAGSVEQIASGDEAQKSSGIQSLINHALSLIEKLGSIQKKAENDVKKDQKGVEEIDKNAQQLETQLNNNILEQGNLINGQTEIVNNATHEIQEAQQDLQEKQEAINEIIEQITAKQKELAEASTIEEKRNLLDEIQELSVQISAQLVDIADYQAAVSDAATSLQSAVTEIETAKGNIVEIQQDGQMKIVENAQQGAEVTSEVSATQVEGVSNIAAGEALLASGTAAKAIPIIGPIAGTGAEQKGADLIAGGTTQTAGSLGNLRELLQGIGKIASNSQLLQTFTKTIGSALGAFDSAVGAWNSSIDPVITSLGSFSSNDIQGQVAELDNAITIDEQVLNSQESGEGDAHTTIVNEGNGEDDLVSVEDGELQTPKVQLRSFGI